MYNPPSFQEVRQDVLLETMRRYPLATLVTTQEGTLSADHIPLLYSEHDGTGILRGHVARGNPLWQRAANQPALAIFHGPEHYISPSLYPSKHQHGKVVPTWNYIAVHASGPLMVHDDPEWSRKLVSELTDVHDGAFARAEGMDPWKVTEAPSEYIEQSLARIVGIELRIENIEGKWKLSQNRPDADRAAIAERLADSTFEGAREMADEVEARRKQ